MVRADLATLKASPATAPADEGLAFPGASAGRRPDATAPHPEPRDQAAEAARFRALVDAYFSFVWRSLRGLGVPPDAADDGAQQVFLVALQKLPSIAAGRERAFLFGTALGVAANARRARARRREVNDEDELAMRADAAPDPEQQSTRNEARAMLDAILSRMPMELSTVFVLFELEELTMAEIAEILGLAAGTVASRLRRAREAFRAEAQRRTAGEKTRLGPGTSGGAA